MTDNPSQDPGAKATPGSTRPDRIATPDQASGLRLGDLSEFFNPFLTYFISETLRSAGEVWVIRDAVGVSGVLLRDDCEKVASLFTRSWEAATGLLSKAQGVSLFAEIPFEAKAEVFHVYSVDLSSPLQEHRFSHPIRRAMGADFPEVFRLMNEVYGPVNETWFDSIPAEREVCLITEVGGEVAGTAWVSLAGGSARLHSLAVRPRFRRLGVGTDLLFGRLLWVHKAGAQRAISEISEHNLASQAIASNGGMRRAGRIFLNHTLQATEGGLYTSVQPSGAPQFGQAFPLGSTRAPQ